MPTSLAEVRNNLAEIINRVSYVHERIIISRHGKNVAAVIPLEDLELLERIEDLIDIKDARKALAEAKKKGTVTLADLDKEMGF